MKALSGEQFGAGNRVEVLVSMDDRNEWHAATYVRPSSLTKHHEVDVEFRGQVQRCTVPNPYIRRINALDIPLWLVDSIEKLIAFDKSQDPSGLGGLNLAAFVGDSIAAVWSARHGARP